MIFKFGKKRATEPDEDEEQEEIEYVLFQGATNGREVDLQSNAKLAQAGLQPAKELVTDALVRRAHMLRLEPKGKVATVGMFVDGVGYPGGRMPPQRALAITQMLKLLAGLETKVRDKPQSAGVKAEFQDVKYEIRVDTSPLKGGGERLTLSINDVAAKDALKKPDDVGFTEEMRTKIREYGAGKKGVLLTCGPPYSGTTTTNYVVLRTIDAYIYSIYSMADTSGHDLFGVSTIEKNPQDDFSASMMRLIRSEADVIFIDPLRDAETAKQVFELQQKVAFVGEFAARDTAHGILKLIEWVGDPKVVAEGLNGLITQKLVRRICDKCKEAYRPNPKLIAKMGLPPETKILHRPPKPPPPSEDGTEEEYKPCKRCGGVGYLGRIGLYELLEMTDAMRALVAQGPKDPAEIKALARKEKMQTLQKDGLRAVVEGKTSLEELQRAFKAS